MLCFTTPQTSVTIFFVGLGLTGLAECFKQSSLTPTLQATLKKEELGSGMSLNSMAGTLGSTLSVCLCGVIQSQIAPDTSVVADLSKACNIIFFTCVVAGVLVILLASTLVRPSKKAEA
jgi:MFS family permease